MTFSSPHLPVLLHDVIEQLQIKKEDIVIDGTIGFGGHSGEILPLLSQKGKLIGLDQDLEALTFCKNRFLPHKNVTLINDNFSNIHHLIVTKKIPMPSKIFLDLGYSSFQLDHSARGFSFSTTQPLDMRMDKNSTITASDILNRYTKEKLSNMFYQLGELHHNKVLSENIIRGRRKKRITTTKELIEIIKNSYKFRNRALMMKIFSQVFQALRIETNQELVHLKHFLEDLPHYLQTGGIICIITFHSIEDRIVKQFFKEHHTLFKPLHKKVIQADQNAIKKNSREKPAKLRSYIRL